MSLKERLDNVFDLQKRGYNVNKRIFRIAFIIMVLLLGVIGFVDGVDVFVNNVWVECPVDSELPCLNPYYDPMCVMSGGCVEPLIMQGEVIGEKPSFLARTFGVVCFGLFFVALGLNHLLYNYKRSGGE